MFSLRIVSNEIARAITACKCSKTENGLEKSQFFSHCEDASQIREGRNVDI